LFAPSGAGLTRLPNETPVLLLAKRIAAPRLSENDLLADVIGTTHFRAIIQYQEKFINLHLFGAQ
jgi:hypothetical protein